MRTSKYPEQFEGLTGVYFLWYVFPSTHPLQCETRSAMLIQLLKINLILCYLITQSFQSFIVYCIPVYRAFVRTSNNYNKIKIMI